MHHVPFDNLPPDGFMRLPAVMAVAGLKRSTIYELIQRGRFPRQTKLVASGRAAGWTVKSVRAWLKNPTAWRADEPDAA